MKLKREPFLSPIEANALLDFLGLTSGKTNLTRDDFRLFANRSLLAGAVRQAMRSGQAVVLSNRNESKSRRHRIAAAKENDLTGELEAIERIIAGSDEMQVLWRLQAQASGVQDLEAFTPTTGGKRVKQVWTFDQDNAACSSYELSLILGRNAQIIDEWDNQDGSLSTRYGRGNRQTEYQTYSQEGERHIQRDEMLWCVQTQISDRTVQVNFPNFPQPINISVALNPQHVPTKVIQARRGRDPRNNGFHPLEATLN